MSSISLYDALVQLGLKKKDAKEVVSEVALVKDIATKEDLLKLKTEIITQVFWIVFALNTLFTTIILGGVGFMIKFL